MRYLLAAAAEKLETQIGKYAIVEIDQQLLTVLVQRRHLFQQLKVMDVPELSFDSWPATFYDKIPEGALSEDEESRLFSQGYTALPVEFVAPDDTTKCHYDRMIVDDQGVSWLASLKYVDFSVQTKQLPWEVLGIEADAQVGVCACPHKWTPIAPEDQSDDAGEEPGIIWEWCLCCGTLRLGDEIFYPGPHQKETIVSGGAPAALPLTTAVEEEGSVVAGLVAYVEASGGDLSGLVHEAARAVAESVVSEGPAEQFSYLLRMGCSPEQIRAHVAGGAGAGAGLDPRITDLVAAIEASGGTERLHELIREAVATTAESIIGEGLAIQISTLLQMGCSLEQIRDGLQPTQTKQTKPS